MNWKQITEICNSTKLVNEICSDFDLEKGILKKGQPIPGMNAAFSRTERYFSDNFYLRLVQL